MSEIRSVPGRAGSEVRTVLGPVDPAELGRMNTHEHAFQVSPLLPGDDLDDEARSTEEFTALRTSGFESVIDATPVGLGRDPEALARLARAAGLHVVATTGLHRDAHYGPDHPLMALGAEERTALLLDDVLIGMPVSDAAAIAAVAAGESGSIDRTDIRAGILKVGLDYWDITASERRTLEAIAEVHARTAVPVMVHLEFCTAAHEVLDLLQALGVDAERVLLAHADRAPDAGLHLELLDRGCTLGYDGMARTRTRTDEELLDLTERVISQGGQRIVLGGDVARATRYRAYGGMPGLAYLGERYLPRLRERIGTENVERLLIEMPRELFTPRTG